MTDVGRAFGNNVRHHRQTLGLKQAQLGHMVGVSVQSISSIEKGALPSMEVAIKLAKYFQVPLSLLVNDMPHQEEPEGDEGPTQQDAIQIQVLKLFRDLAVAPDDSRTRVADWIRELGNHIAGPGTLPLALDGAPDGTERVGRRRLPQPLPEPREPGTKT